MGRSAAITGHPASGARRPPPIDTRAIAGLQLPALDHAPCLATIPFPPMSRAPAPPFRLEPAPTGQAAASAMQPPRVLAKAFARIDAIALGASTGAVAGLAIWFGTAWLLVKGGAVVGPNLSLLAQYFPGFTVSWTGAAIGLLYGSAAGFAAGWLYATRAT